LVRTSSAALAQVASMVSLLTCLIGDAVIRVSATAVQACLCGVCSQPLPVLSTPAQACMRASYLHCLLDNRCGATRGPWD
jgi:hypothetical protein